ncbi:ATP-dependent nuclease [Acinetobacter junii]|uniref:ATP-dependent nuclease n=2 Tax=Acinetobacter junii TaxID=40215 RepID=UPI0012507B0E|nr:AAA family ATPase [Acinetobacter junii]
MNTNSNLDFFSNINIDDHNLYPFFLKDLEFQIFRHIPHLKIDFQHPISIISGTNRSGKTTILMALACSHLNFMRRNPNNGNLERNTWSSLMKFTNHDKQLEDWTYYINYRKGTKFERKRGQRKALTNKWNGVGKKESQFNFRDVVFIDLDRILPARFFTAKVFSVAKRSSVDNLSPQMKCKLERYLSHILEQQFSITAIAKVNDKDVFNYTNSFEYSSFNTATGEDVLTRILIDIIEANEKSLILIDEIEMGLHPKVQRRLMDVIRDISRNEKKQFIITSHSSTILDEVNPESRIFIEKTHTSQYRAINNISVSAALTKMDAKSFPLVDLYCEDKIAKKIIMKGILFCAEKNEIQKLNELINIIPIGSADDVYKIFKSQMDTYSLKKIKSGYACILDGDMKLKQNRNSQPLYPAHQNLHFIYSNESPEKFLTRFYLDCHPNVAIQYYLDNVNNHYFFQSIIENSALTDEEEVFNCCWNIFKNTPQGENYLNELSSFIFQVYELFSQEL